MGIAGGVVKITLVEMLAVCCWVCHSGYVRCVLEDITGVMEGMVELCC